MASKSSNQDQAATIEKIKISDIAPESTVNVRETDVKSNIEKIEQSIDEHGYWDTHPILVRKNSTKENGEYKYEYIAGQCRLKASINLGKEKIPAINLGDIKDKEAKIRSWGENETRGNLSGWDKYKVTSEIYKFYRDEKDNGKEDLDPKEKTAADLNISTTTVTNYCNYHNMPDKLKDIVKEKDSITIGDAYVIYKYTEAEEEEDIEEKQVERGHWMKDLDKNDRTLARKVMKEVDTSTASIKELEDIIKEKKDKQNRTYNIELGTKTQKEMADYGDERGMTEDELVKHIIVKFFEK